MHCRKSFPFGFATVLSLGTLAIAQGPAPAPLMVHQLKPNVYWIEGGGGNSGVIIGDKGVIVIDAKTTPAGGKELLDNVAKITPKPVTTVILTHSDGDHVNGLLDSANKLAFPNAEVLVPESSGNSGWTTAR